MKKRRNKLNPQVFQNAKQSLERMFPQVPKKAFYIAGAQQSNVLPKGMATVAVSAMCEIVGGALHLRIYRRPKNSSAVLYKVDELRGINKAITLLPTHDEIEDHHISHDIPEDMMNRNQMTVEYVPDGNGGLKPNIQPDGMVKTYINFPDPTETTLKKAMSKRRVTDSETPKSRQDTR